jgi:hypothetical protein
VSTFESLYWILQLLQLVLICAALWLTVRRGRTVWDSRRLFDSYSKTCILLWLAVMMGACMRLIIFFL